MSFYWLTEDGNFEIALEDSSGLYLQEFDSVNVLITGASAITTAEQIEVSQKAIISANGSVSASNSRAITDSASLSATAQVFSIGFRAVGGTASISATASINSAGTIEISQPIDILADAVVTATNQNTAEQSVSISASATVSVRIQSIRPEPITNFRVTRSGASAVLNWVNGLRTDRVEVYRSTTERNTFSKIGETSGATFTDNTINGTNTYAYKLIPVGVTGARGKTSFVVYTATTQIL